MSTRTSRNSIPKVNQNPRPPNEPNYGLARAQPARARVGVGQNQPAPSPGHLGQQQALQNRTTPSGGGNAAPSPPPALAPPTDPRDARYWQDAAQLTFTRDIGNQRLNTEDIFSKTNLDREISNRDYLDPIEVQRTREGANVGGFIYSTAHQENLGNLGQEQFQKRASLNEAYQRALAQRALERQQIEGEYNLGLGNIGLGAAERASEAELGRPVYLGGEGAGNTASSSAIAKRAGTKNFARNAPISRATQNRTSVANNQPASGKKKKK